MTYLRNMIDFADLLQACGVVDAAAVYDPEGYDGGATLGNIAELHKRLVAAKEEVEAEATPAAAACPTCGNGIEEAVDRATSGDVPWLDTTPKP